MVSQTPPGDRTPPAPPSVPAAESYSEAKCIKCLRLVEWWLESLDGKICIAGLTETPQMRKEGGFSQGSMKSAARVFKCAIAKVHDSVTVETVNGRQVRLSGTLNNTRMHENGFSEKVCFIFLGGFPLTWKKHVGLNMEQTNGHAQSPQESADNAPNASEKYYSVGTPNCGKTPVKLKTGDEGMTPQAGAVRASEENKAMTLRSGKVLGGPISAPLTGGYKRKRTQHKTSENIQNDAVSTTADLNSHENVCSVAAAFDEDKLKSHDSHRRGRGRPCKEQKKIQG